MKKSRGFVPIQSGFTLVDVLIVGFFVAVLYVLTTQSLFRGQHSITLSETTNQVVRDLRDAQSRAMHGKTSQSGGLVDHSVRFESDRYILYPGVVYDENNPENRIEVLPSTMSFAVITLLDNTATFARGSGDVRNFASGTDSVSLTDTAIGKTDTLRINSRGVVFVSHE